MNDYPAPFQRYSGHADGSDGLQHQMSQLHSGPGVEQQLVASDLEAMFQQRIQKLAHPASWQQIQAPPPLQPSNGLMHFDAERYTGLEIQEGNVSQMHGVEAPGLVYQDIQDSPANPSHLQNLDYRMGLSRFLAVHSAQIGRGHPSHNLPDFRRELSTSHEHHMESVGSGRLVEQTLPPSTVLERPGETAELRADFRKGPQAIFTVEEYPHDDEQILDGLSPFPTMPEVKVMKEVPEWAPLFVHGGACLERPVEMKPADKRLLKWVFGSDYPSHWD